MQEIFNRITIRKIRRKELPILEDMLYESVYQAEGEKPYPRDIIKIPKIYAYIDQFGIEKDDHCFVSVLNDKIIGAVWVRIIAGEIKGFGNIDDKTPEFAISLYKEYRNNGIGTKLMSTMIEHLKKLGYKRTSLSVQKSNYAANLYKKLGFNIIDENDEDFIMLLELNK